MKVALLLQRVKIYGDGISDIYPINASYRIRPTDFTITKLHLINNNGEEDEDLSSLVKSAIALKVRKLQKRYNWGYWLSS